MLGDWKVPLPILRALTLGLLWLTPVRSQSSTDEGAQSRLGRSALEEILERGAPILGDDTGCSGTLCDWQKDFSDDTKLVHMNLPGTHDTATWNYSAETQASLFRYTGSDIYPSTFRRCQEQSLFHQLNNGVRVFDWRVSYNPGNDTLGFYHAEALLAPATRVEDVLFGFYSWLDKHPSEALLISIKDESGPGRVNDAGFQMKLYNMLNSKLAKQYWVQTDGTLGTLGEARGKMTLLQRFQWNLLPNTPEYSSRFGIYLSPSIWTDNGPDITLRYNDEQNQIAYIEDFYEPNGASSAEESITWKYNATVAHLEKAITLEKDQLFISFSSAELISFDPPITPRIMALGDDSTSGVNQRLLPWLQAHRGERLGIIMLDFFDSVPGLVEAVIGL